jgi:hypothetical protein
MRRLVVGLLWSCVTLLVQAQALSATPVLPEDYQRIEAERVREGAILDTQDAACYQHFAVNDCLKKVQSRRIALMADLKRQEARLHARERQQQAAEALQRIEQKALEQQQKQEEVQAGDGGARTQDKLREQQDKQAQHAAKAASGTAPVSPPAATGPTAQEQAQARASYERKQADAEKKRQELARRQSEKAGKAAKPLPLPQAP